MTLITFRLLLAGALGFEDILPHSSSRRHCDSQRPKPWGTALSGVVYHQARAIQTCVCCYNETCAGWFPHSNQSQTRMKWTWMLLKITTTGFDWWLKTDSFCILTLLSYTSSSSGHVVHKWKKNPSDIHFEWIFFNIFAPLFPWHFYKQKWHDT